MNVPASSRRHAPHRPLRALGLLGLAFLLLAPLCPARVIDSTSWGSEGTGDGQFRSPSGIAASSAGVFVLDTYNNRVQEFDFNGRFLRKWGANGSAHSQFNSPRGIAVDKNNGNVIVADTGNHRIQMFDRSGKFLRAWGAHGGNNGQFSSPFAVAVGPDHSIYVLDSSTKLQKFNQYGNFERKWTVTSPTGGGCVTEGVAVSPQDQVYVVERHSSTSSIIKYNAEGRELFRWGTPMQYPRGLAVNSLGLVLLSGGYWDKNIRVYDGASGHEFESFTIYIPKTVWYKPARTFQANAITLYQDDTVLCLENVGGIEPAVTKVRFF